MSDEQNKPTPASKIGSSGKLAILGAVFAALIFACVNMLSAQWFRSARIDLTQQKLYSLSNGTKQLIASIDEPIRMRFFLSAQLTKEAPQLAAFAQRVRTMLDAYVAASNGRIRLEIVDPRPFSEDEDRAVALGVSQYRASTGDRVFFGLAATNSTDGKANIPAFSPEREAFLEYDLTRMIAELGRRGKPVIALFDGLGLAGNPQMRQPQQQTLLQMQQFFNVQQVGGDVENLPKDTRVVMVVHPQSLSDKSLFTIDQWALNGGATMIFVDPWAENQMGPGGRPMPDASSNMEKLFKAWGVDYDPKRAVADVNYAFKAERMINERPVTMINLPWMALRGDALKKQEAILAQLQAVVMTTAGAFATTKAGMSIRPLITGSPDGGTIEADKVRDRNADLRELVPQIKKDGKPPVIAGRLVGKLDSAFTEKPADSKHEGEFKAKGDKDANVILVGDADMLMDRNWVQRREILGSQVAQAFANNGDFVNNAIEQMAGGPALTDLRGRGVSWRPFETIQKMETEASAKYSAKEQQLTQRLKEAEEKLSQLSRAGGDKPGAKGNEVLTPEQVATIDKFKQDVLSTREELRQVQFALRSDVDRLKSWITGINVAGVPLVVGFIALLFALRRPRRDIPKKDAPPRTES
jgi:ABC-type uncharacterized transport system involved in gliding motility auxiliary subunit